MKIQSFLLILFFGFSAYVFAQEDADLAKEVKLHNIYQKYMAEPTSEEAWQAAIQTAESQDYSVQDGDTLSDISETFFADPEFWPKIWSLNSSEILNPHEIEPDQVITFTAGTMGEAPSVGVEKEGSGEAVVEEESVPESEIPPPTKVSNKKIQPPESLPPWTYTGKIKKFQMELTSLVRNFGSGDIPLTYYVEDQPLKSEGSVVQTEFATNTGAEFHYIYVKLMDANAKKLLVIKDLGEVNDPFAKGAKVLQIQAEIEVLDVVNPKENIFRAKVTRSFHLAEVGAQLVQADIPMMNSSIETDSPITGARIVGGAFSTKRVLFGNEAVVFINAGSKQGVNVGQGFPIYKNQKIRDAKTLEEINARPIGKLKIVKVAEGFSTAVVIQADSEIQVGDLTDATPAAKEE